MVAVVEASLDLNPRLGQAVYDTGGTVWFWGSSGSRWSARCAMTR
jgi:hypothetical protein